MTRRSRGREIALQVLYQIEQNPGMPVTEVHQFINRRSLGEQKLVEFTAALIAGVREHQTEIDAMIQEVAENWRLDRMAAIDRNILRLGANQVLFFCPDGTGQGRHQRGAGTGETLQYLSIEPLRQRDS